MKTKSKRKAGKAGKAKPIRKSNAGKRPSNGESKRAICAGLLTRDGGCTGKELLEATGWPTISVPATAKALGLKLRIEKNKGQPAQYFGTAA